MSAELASTARHYLTTDHGISVGESTVAYAYRHRPGKRNPFFNSRMSYGKTVAQA